MAQITKKNRTHKTSLSFKLHKTEYEPMRRYMKVITKAHKGLCNRPYSYLAILVARFSLISP